MNANAMLEESWEQSHCTRVARCLKRTFTWEGSWSVSLMLPHAVRDSGRDAGKQTEGAGRHRKDRP